MTLRSANGSAAPPGVRPGRPLSALDRTPACDGEVHLPGARPEGTGRPNQGVTARPLDQAGQDCRLPRDPWSIPEPGQRGLGAVRHALGEPFDDPVVARPFERPGDNGGERVEDASGHGASAVLAYLGKQVEDVAARDLEAESPGAQDCLVFREEPGEPRLDGGGTERVRAERH